jgi:hypothetical protein
VRQNLDPKWDAQDFVFDLPPDAPRHPRMFVLRLRVLGHDMFTAADFLGQASGLLKQLFFFYRKGAASRQVVCS